MRDQPITAAREPVRGFLPDVVYGYPRVIVDARYVVALETSHTALVAFVEYLRDEPDTDLCPTEMRWVAKLLAQAEALPKARGVTG